MVASLVFHNERALLWKSENHNKAISILTKITFYQEPKNFSLYYHFPFPGASGWCQSGAWYLVAGLLCPGVPKRSVTSDHSRLCRRPVFPDFFLEITLSFGCGRLPRKQCIHSSKGPSNSPEFGPPRTFSSPGGSCTLCSPGLLSWMGQASARETAGGRREGGAGNRADRRAGAASCAERGCQGSLPVVGGGWWRGLLGTTRPSGSWELCSPSEHKPGAHVGPGQLWEARLLPARASGAPDRLRTSKTSCRISHHLGSPPHPRRLYLIPPGCPSCFLPLFVAWRPPASFFFWGGGLN